MRFTSSVVGDSHAGVWNETEAISLMIKSAKTLGCAPELEEKLSWLPVDYAAAAIDQLMFSQASTDTATGESCSYFRPNVEVLIQGICVQNGCGTSLIHKQQIGEKCTRDYVLLD